MFGRSWHRYGDGDQEFIETPPQNGRRKQACDIETSRVVNVCRCLAMTPWELGEQGEAVEHAERMLVLNPNDIQGVRRILVSCLLELERHDVLGRLLETYGDDAMAAWPYARTLLGFRTSGDSQDARKMLRLALRRTRTFPLSFWGSASCPRVFPTTSAEVTNARRCFSPIASMSRRSNCVNC